MGPCAARTHAVDLDVRRHGPRDPEIRGRDRLDRRLARSAGTAWSAERDPSYRLDNVRSDHPRGQVRPRLASGLSRPDEPVLAQPCGYYGPGLGPALDVIYEIVDGLVGEAGRDRVDGGEQFG